MPTYSYRDENGHETTIAHSFHYSTAIICAGCGLEMTKLAPRNVSVNWGGPKPSDGGIHPKVKGLVDTAPERRDEFEKLHESHEEKGITQWQEHPPG